MNIYESDKLLAEYLLFHFARPEEILPWEFGPREALDYPVRVTQHFSPGQGGRALDLGCAVGRSTYELSRSSQEVIGIDYSHAFITAAEEIKAGPRRIARLEEAHRATELLVSLPAGVDPSRCQFEQGDAMNLRADLGRFDRVLAANLICRLPEPEKFLARLPDLVHPGGEVVLATPCTWLEEFTPPGNWPPGHTLDWLKETLSRDFELRAEADEPFLIRETARKFQWTVALVTKWQRREG
ncbi:methyltransferase domain-containing protein [Roseibacillus ishigakijimensis]|uniref:Methyltransferase domain-containing protein n=1 Tax=Roseibacillus ishigakijimensis TaxID=454146 RepID=A0A934RQL2_9BACT|nr:methyltransferase domain-containing protein [Roseibacillus ishigakijimensis]MBK1832455.1 methyltransferase domain-containing protein [Roseibacillus ishigakijimensis]